MPVQNFNGAVGQVAGHTINNIWLEAQPPDDPEKSIQCPQCGRLTWRLTRHCIHCQLDLVRWAGVDRGRRTLHAVMRVATAMLAVVMVGCAAAPTQELPSEVFARRIDVIDDPMSTQIVVTTPKVSILNPSRRTLRGEVFLSAMVDRRHGTSKVFANAVYEHTNGRWVFFSHGTYLAADGLARDASQFVRGPTDVGYCMAGSSCTYSETASFAVPEEVLRQVVQRRSDASAPQRWRVRFSGESDEIDAAIRVDYVLEFLVQLEQARLLVKR